MNRRDVVARLPGSVAAVSDSKSTGELGTAAVVNPACKRFKTVSVGGPWAYALSTYKSPGCRHTGVRDLL
jgi:hypothetical protein